MYIFVYVIFDWPYLSKHLVQQKCKQLIFLWAAVYTHIFLIFYQWSFYNNMYLYVCVCQLFLYLL